MSAPRSIAWSLGGQIASMGASMVSTVILARLLTPTEFGVFAFAATIFSVVQWLLQMGMGQYILREAEMPQDKLNAALAGSLAQGAAASVIVLALAPFAAWFGQLERIGLITAAVAVVPFLGAPEATCDGLWLRQGRYGSVAILQVAKGVVATAVSISVEFTWHLGAFSLAAGLVVSMLLSFVVAIYSLMITNHARVRMTLDQWRLLRSFGGRSFALTLAQVGSLRVPDLLIGRLLSVAMLGHYNRAGAALDTVNRTMSTSVVRASSPTFYRRVNEGAALGWAVGDFMDTVLFFVWPSLAGVAVLSEPLIRLLYGPQWAIAAEALPILCLGFAIDSARTGGMETLLIRDRLGLNAKIEGVHAIYAILLVVLAAPYGLKAVLWARVLDSVVTLAIYWLVMLRFDALLPGRTVRILALNAVLALGAGAPPLLLMAAWHWPEKLDVLGYAATIGSGVGLWLLLLLVFRHPYLVRGIEMLRNRLRLRPDDAGDVPTLPEYNGTA
jgi:O-antigen/teichoic acid export membrane protein